MTARNEDSANVELIEPEKVQPTQAKELKTSE